MNRPTHRRGVPFRTAAAATFACAALGLGACSSDESLRSTSTSTVREPAGAERTTTTVATAPNGQPSAALPEGFLAGVNVPWNEFGQDAGCGKFDQAWFDRTFADIAEQGVTSVRYWLHASGGCTPSFAADGTPTGLPPTAIPEATAILDAAERNGLSVLLVLFSHDIGATNSTFPFGHHTDMVTTPAKRQAYLDLALTPLVQALDAHPALLAWETINEPELIAEGVGSDRDRAVVPKADLQAFAGSIAATIHRNGTKPVTLGAMSAEFISSANEPVDQQWWTDAALGAATGDTDAYLDFYQVHFYDYQGTTSPFDIDLTQPEFAQGKPVVVGEFPFDVQRGLGDAIAALRDMGYRGTYPWAVNDECCGAWKTARSAIAERYAR